MLQMIDILTIMFNLGFFNELKSFKEMFENMIKILEKTDEIVMEVNEIGKNVEKTDIDYASLEVPTNILNIKKKICHLLKTLLEIQNDFKLSAIIEQYKNIVAEDQKKVEKNSAKAKN